MKTHPSFASQRPFYYTISVVDHAGRTVGVEEIKSAMTRAGAYKRLLGVLKSLEKTDDLIYGGYLSRDERNRK
jgi:hypothetical protein